MDLTEAEDIKKRWQEYTEDIYKKDLHDPDNHDGVITSLRIPGCLALAERSHLRGYLGHEDLLCTVLPCILATSS